MQISPTGLLSYSLIEKDSLLVTNFGFDKGEHFWEIIAPFNCNGMNIGVVEDKYNLNDLNLNKDNSKFIVQSFRTSTTRNIGTNYIKFIYKNINI